MLTMHLQAAEPLERHVKAPPIRFGSSHEELLAVVVIHGLHGDPGA